MTSLFRLLLIGGVILLLHGCFFKDPAIKQIDTFITQQHIDKSDINWRTKLTIPPKLSFAEDTKYYWLLETSLGNLKFELLNKSAPMHVSSTIYLTQLGFYNDLTFHRVINGFMAQGGDPLGSGRGNPGYRYGGEFEPLVPHDQKGLLSMANSGPNTDGSQFFITFRATPHLNGLHTVFGRLISDEAVLAKLNDYGTRFGKPKHPITINRAHILVE